MSETEHNPIPPVGSLKTDIPCPLPGETLRFRKLQHLRSTRDFARIYETGQRAGDSHLLIFAQRNVLGLTRIGLSVSRKHGSAVDRNLRKRRIREAFRLVQHRLPAGLDLILIPRQGELSRVTDLVTSLRRLTEKLDRRLPHPNNSNAPESPDV